MLTWLSNKLPEPSRGQRFRVPSFQSGQYEAGLKLYNAAEGQFAIADTAIIEVVFVLTRQPYNFSRKLAAEAVRNIMGLPKITCNRALFDRALPQFVKHPALSFEDCCLAAYARLNQAEPLWTFDKKLAGQLAEARLLK